MGGAARALFREMDAIALVNGAQAPELEAGAAWGRLRELPMPVLVVSGELDVATISARCSEIATAVADGRHVELAGVAHLPALEAPGAFAEVLLPFLDEVLGGR